MHVVVLISLPAKLQCRAVCRHQVQPASQHAQDTHFKTSAGNAVMRWVMWNVKLLLEWVTVPIFIIALQLPQGAVLYWLASSLTALAQVRCL